MCERCVCVFRNVEISKKALSSAAFVLLERTASNLLVGGGKCWTSKEQMHTTFTRIRDATHTHSPPLPTQHRHSKGLFLLVPLPCGWLS